MTARTINILVSEILFEFNNTDRNMNAQARYLPIDHLLGLKSADFKEAGYLHGTNRPREVR